MPAFIAYWGARRGFCWICYARRRTDQYLLGWRTLAEASPVCSSVLSCNRRVEVSSNSDGMVRGGSGFKVGVSRSGPAQR